MLGTQDAAYWVSWIITAEILNLIMTCSVIGFGNFYGYEVFTNTPPSIWFWIIFNTCNAYLSLCFFLNTIITNRTQAFTVNFAVILCSMIINMVLSEPTTLKKIFFNENNVSWVEKVTFLFYLIPCFNFGKMFGDVTSIVCAKFDTQSLSWNSDAKRPFLYEDIFHEQKGSFFSGDRYTVSSLARTQELQTYLAFFYLVCAWYFDNVIA